MPLNIGDNRVVEDGIARITEADAKRLSRYRVKAGDVVYSRRGDVRRRALIRKEHDGWVVYKKPHVTALRSAEVVVVCKRTGRVLYEGSVNDEG